MLHELPGAVRAEGGKGRVTSALLRRLAAKYETAAFLEDDPSRFMHLASGAKAREAAAFAAAALSFGSRPVFMRKIDELFRLAAGDIDAWTRNGDFEKVFAANDGACFYRFFTRGDMHGFFSRYREILREHGSLGALVRESLGGSSDGAAAAAAIVAAFGGRCKPIPKSAASACKRICMFLRWMVRDGSPVDLGLWSDFIDKRTLPAPLDVHAMRQAERLGLLQGRHPSMKTAMELSSALRRAFPGDPLKGDFALFGYGVNAPREERGRAGREASPRGG